MVTYEFIKRSFFDIKSNNFVISGSHNYDCRCGLFGCQSCTGSTDYIYKLDFTITVNLYIGSNGLNYIKFTGINGNIIPSTSGSQPVSDMREMSFYGDLKLNGGNIGKFYLNRKNSNSPVTLYAPAKNTNNYIQISTGENNLTLENLKFYRNTRIDGSETISNPGKLSSISIGNFTVSFATVKNTGYYFPKVETTSNGHVSNITLFNDIPTYEFEYLNGFSTSSPTLYVKLFDVNNNELRTISMGTNFSIENGSPITIYFDHPLSISYLPSRTAKIILYFVPEDSANTYLNNKNYLDHYASMIIPIDTIHYRLEERFENIGNSKKNVIIISGNETTPPSFHEKITGMYYKTSEDSDIYELTETGQDDLTTAYVILNKNDLNGKTLYIKSNDNDTSAVATGTTLRFGTYVSTIPTNLNFTHQYNSNSGELTLTSANDLAYRRLTFNRPSSHYILDSAPQPNFITSLPYTQDLVSNGNIIMNVRQFEDLQWTIEYGFTNDNPFKISGSSLKTFPSEVFADVNGFFNGTNKNVLSYVPYDPILVHNTLHFSGSELSFKIQMDGIHDDIVVRYNNGTEHTNTYKRSYTGNPPPYSYTYDISFSTTLTELRYLEGHGITVVSNYNGKQSYTLTIIKSNTVLNEIHDISLVPARPYEYTGFIDREEDPTFGEYPTTGFDVYFGISANEITYEAEIKTFLQDKKLASPNQFSRYAKDINKQRVLITTTELTLSESERDAYFEEGTMGPARNNGRIYVPKEGFYYYMTALPSGANYNTYASRFAIGDKYEQVIPEPNKNISYNESNHKLDIKVDNTGFFERYPDTDYNVGPLKLLITIRDTTGDLPILNVSLSKEDVKNEDYAKLFEYNDSSNVEVDISLSYLDVYTRVITQEVSIIPAFYNPTDVEVKNIINESGTQILRLTFKHKGVSTRYSVRGFTLHGDSETTYFTKDVDYLREGLYYNGERVGETTYTIVDDLIDGDLTFTEDGYDSIETLRGLNNLYIDVNFEYYDRTTSNITSNKIIFIDDTIDGLTSTDIYPYGFSGLIEKKEDINRNGVYPTEGFDVYFGLSSENLDVDSNGLKTFLLENKLTDNNQFSNLSSSSVKNIVFSLVDLSLTEPEINRLFRTDINPITTTPYGIKQGNYYYMTVLPNYSNFNDNYDSNNVIKIYYDNIIPDVSYGVSHESNSVSLNISNFNFFKIYPDASYNEGDMKITSDVIIGDTTQSIDSSRPLTYDQIKNGYTIPYTSNDISQVDISFVLSYLDVYTDNYSETNIEITPSLLAPENLHVYHKIDEDEDELILSFNHKGVSTSYYILGYDVDTNMRYFQSDVQPYLHEGFGVGNESFNITGQSFIDSDLSFENGITSISDLIGKKIEIDLYINYYDRFVQESSNTVSFNYDITMSDAIPRVDLNANKILNISTSISNEDIFLDFNKGISSFILRLFGSSTDDLSVSDLRDNTSVDVSQSLVYTNESLNISLNGDLINFEINFDDLDRPLQETSSYLYFFVDISINDRILLYNDSKNPSRSGNLTTQYDNAYPDPTFNLSYNSETETLTVTDICYGNYSENITDISLTVLKENWKNSGDSSNVFNYGADTTNSIDISNINDTSNISLEIAYNVDHIILNNERKTTNLLEINPKPNELVSPSFTVNEEGNTFLQVQFEYIGSVSRFDIRVEDTSNGMQIINDTKHLSDEWYYNDTVPFVYDISYILSSPITDSGDRFKTTITTYGIGTSPETLTYDMSLVFLLTPSIERIYPFTPGYFGIDISLTETDLNNQIINVYYKKTSDTEYKKLVWSDFDLSLSHSSNLNTIKDDVLNEDISYLSNIIVYPSEDDYSSGDNGRGIFVVKDSLLYDDEYDIRINVQDEDKKTCLSVPITLPNNRYQNMFNDVSFSMEFSSRKDSSLNIVDLSFIITNDYVNSLIIWYDASGSTPDFTDISRTIIYTYNDISSYELNKTYTTSISFEEDGIIDITDVSFTSTIPYIAPYSLDSSDNPSKVYLTDLSFYEISYKITDDINTLFNVVDIYTQEDIDLSNISTSIKVLFNSDLSFETPPLSLETPYIPYPIEPTNIHILNLELEGDNSLNIQIFYEDISSAFSNGTTTIPITGISLEVIDLSDGDSEVANLLYTREDMSFGGFYANPRVPILNVYIDITGHLGDGTIESIHEFEVKATPYMNERSGDTSSRINRMSEFDISAISVYVPREPYENYAEMFTLSLEVFDAQFINQVYVYRYETQVETITDPSLALEFEFYGIEDPSNNPYLVLSNREIGANTTQMNIVGETSANTFYVLDESTVVLSTYRPDILPKGNYYYSWFTEVLYRDEPPIFGIDLSVSLIPNIQATATQQLLADYEIKRISFNDIQNKITLELRDGFIREGDISFNSIMKFFISIFSVNDPLKEIYEDFNETIIYELENRKDPSTGLPDVIEMDESTSSYGGSGDERYKLWTITVPFDKTYHSLITIMRDYRDMDYIIGESQQLYPLYTPVSVSNMGTFTGDIKSNRGSNMLFYFELPPPETASAVDKYIIYRWLRDTAVTDTTVDTDFSYKNILEGNTGAFIWKEIQGSLRDVYHVDTVDPSMSSIPNREKVIYDTSTRRVYLQEIANKEIFSEKTVVFRVAVLYKDLPDRKRGVLGVDESYDFSELPINFAQFHEETFVQFTIPKLCLCPPVSTHPRIIDSSTVKRTFPRRIINSRRVKYYNR
jgi:hypothetical protein